MSYAHLIVVGNIGTAEVLKSKAGNDYVRMSIAINHGRRESRTTTWYSVLLFGKLAENLEKLKFYTKGRMVAVGGRPQAQAFIKKDGSPGVDNTIVATEWPELLDDSE